MELTPRSVVETPTPVQVSHPQDPRDPIWLPAIDEDYPETEESIAAAFEACNAERAELGLAPQESTIHQHRMHADLEAIYRMMERRGAKQVWLWVKNAAAERGYKGE